MPRDVIETKRRRIPLAAIAVFGVGGMMALAVGVALYLGLTSAAENTRRLWAEQSETLIDSMQQSVEVELRPVVEQARWIAKHVASGAVDPANIDSLDDFMFGVLAATPQVAGLAFVTPDGHSRRWERATAVVVSEDWSAQDETKAWLQSGRAQPGSSWRAPIWTSTIGETAILHDMPLRRGSEFLGMLGQIVPTAGLSRELGRRYTGTGLTPFILYGRQRVLAHPLLINWVDDAGQPIAPLLGLGQLGDPVLERIWSPDDTSPSFLHGLTRSTAVGANFDDNYFLYLYREIEGYGPEPWTVGAYLNTRIQDGDEARRIFLATITGLAVLVLSVGCAIWLARRMIRPIAAIAAAARLVQDDRFAEAPTLAPSRVRELDDATRSFNHMVQGLRERQLIRETLGRFVPEEVAATLLSGGGNLQPEQVEATVLFCDLENFTSLTETLGPAGTIDMLNAYFSAMVEILERHDGVATQFQGDAILATFNVPIAHPEHARNALRAACEMLKRVRNEDFAGQHLGIRVGINTGPVVAGAVGAQGRLSYTVHGDAVNLAARLESLNKEYGSRILLSENTARAVSGFELRSVGETAVRGQSKSIELYALAE